MNVIIQHRLDIISVVIASNISYVCQNQQKWNDKINEEINTIQMPKNQTLNQLH